MAFDAKAVANYFLDRAAQEGAPIDHMKLQKLVYIAHGWHLAITDSPLLANRVEAWAYGPVIPELYREFRSCGSRPIDRPATVWDQASGQYRVMRLQDCGEPPGLLKQSEKVLDGVWSNYKELSALQLSALTHQKGTPWSAAREQATSWPSPPIPDPVIRQHYIELAKRNRQHATR